MEEKKKRGRKPKSEVGTVKIEVETKKEESTTIGFQPQPTKTIWDVIKAIFGL